MPRTRSATARPVAGWWSRLLDGPHVWGSADVWAGRYGFRRYRLFVFPPGVTPADRRFVRLWRGWPMWGALVWVAAEIALGNMLSPAPAVAGSTAAYLAAGAITFVLAGEVRKQARSLQFVLIDEHHDPHSAQTYAVWKELVGALAEADELVDEGKASPVAHEAVWWQVYDRLGDATASGR